MACEAGMIDLLPRLHALGVNINHISQAGETALMWACSHGEAVIVKALLAAGADPNVSHMGKFALSIAVTNDYSDLNIVQGLLEAGADINQTDKNGNHALLLALKHPPLVWRRTSGVPDIVRILVQHGININSVSVRSCLSLALRDLNLQAVAEYLLSEGADVHIVDEDGTSPLMLTCRLSSGLPFASRVLHLLRVSEIDAVDKDGFTALMHACQAGDENVVQLLLNAGASTTPCNATSLPLITAVLGGHIGIVKVLISAGADINGRDKQGVTPMTAARENAHTDIIEELCKSGAEKDSPRAVESRKKNTNKLNAPSSCAASSYKIDLVLDKQEQYVELLKPFHLTMALENATSVVRAQMGAKDVFVKLAHISRIDNLEHELRFLMEVHSSSSPVQNVVKNLLPHVIRGDCGGIISSTDDSPLNQLCGIVLETGSVSVKEILQESNIVETPHLRFSVLSEVLTALCQLETCGIVHMDVKASNIMLFKHRYKLIDFDASLRSGEGLGDVMKWTTQYAAPELIKYKHGVIESLKVSHKVDMWSFGMLMVEIRLGRDFWSVNEVRNEKDIELGLLSMTQNDIDKFLADNFACDADASFLSAVSGALQLNPANRLRACALKNKSYFAGGDSTQLHERVRNNDEVLLNIRAVRRKVEANGEVLVNILRGMTFIPSLFVIVPIVKSGLIDKLRTTDEYRLYFVCPVTRIPGNSGIDGQGYVIRANKEWVRKVAPAIELCFCIFKVLLAIGGLPLPIGDISAMESIFGGLKSGKEVVKLGQKSFEKNLAGYRSKAKWSHLQSMSGESFQLIYAMVQSIENPPKPVAPSWVPQYTGLLRTVCRIDGSVNWVHADVAEDYEEEGSALLKNFEELQLGIDEGDW